MPPTSLQPALPALPEADDRLLARPPLDLVICEVRTLPSPGLVLEPNEGLRLKDAATAAGFAVQRLEQAQQQSVRLEVVAGQPAAPSIELHNIGWQLIAPEAGCVATVMPGVMTLQTTQYRSWAETFRPLLASVLTAVGEVLA